MGISAVKLSEAEANMSWIFLPSWNLLEISWKFGWLNL